MTNATVAPGHTVITDTDANADGSIKFNYQTTTAYAPGRRRRFAPNIAEPIKSFRLNQGLKRRRL
jgi:hypothetical protein